MTKQRVADALQNVAEKVHHSADGLTADIAMQAAHKARELAGQAQAVYGQAVDHARDAVENVSERAKQQPLMALLIAGLAGYALGWLAFRRGSAKR